MNLEKSLGLEITKYNKPKIENGKLIRYEFELGDVKYSASSDYCFQKEFMQALLKHQHEKVESPKLDEETYGRKFIYQINTIINLHNHPFWEDD
jgi:hypothetical protein